MIHVKAVYIGNAQEAFIENRFTNGINIIYSDDNHVGKTVVMQSIMYALGAVKQFPASFPDKNYSFIVDLEIDGWLVSILRNKDSFIVLDGDEVIPLENATRFDEYWNEHISELPVIVKEGRSRLTPLAVYTQMAFIPQTERSTSRLRGGYFKPDDFMEMLYSAEGLSARKLDSKQIGELKAEKKELQARRSELLKQAKLLKQPGTSLSIISPTVDREEKERQIKRLNELKNSIVDLRKKRNRTLIRMKKNEAVLDEINSLNLEVKSGSVVCLDCGSHSIGYQIENAEFVFDITTAEMREQMKASIRERIAAYGEEAGLLEREIRELQSKFNSMADIEEVTLGDVLASQEEYVDIKGIDDDITRITDHIAEIDRALKDDSAIDNEQKEKRKEFRDELLSTMTSIRRQLNDGIDVLPYERLFTTQTNSYSGSEATEFLVARLYALAQRMQHGLPLLIDSFRAEELSSSREGVVLDIFERLEYQYILTATLKDDEVAAEKYFDRDTVNKLDYCGYPPNALLSTKWNEAFVAKIAEFKISFKK